MINNKKVLCIVPARGGSKGISGKNIIEINGKPLIGYTLETAKKSKYIDKIIVSTDDPKIAKVANDFGIIIKKLRPIELAEDETKTIDVIIYEINELLKLNEKFDYVVLLQPTSPLRRTFHIDQALESIIENNKDSLVSVTKVKNNPLLIRSINETGELESILKANSTVRRQDFNTYYVVNGAIYINKIDQSFGLNTSLNDNVWPYIMEEKYDIDIDTIEDIEEFKKKLNALILKEID